MQFGQFLDQGTERVKQTVAEEFLERGSIAELANAALFLTYPKALRARPDFYQTSAAATITSSVVPKPANLQVLLSLTLTNVINPAGGDFTNRQATPVPSTQWDSVNASSVQQGTATNPKFRQDAASIFLVPFQNASSVNFTGTFHFLRNFSPVTDEAFELSYPNVNALPIIPWTHEEDAMFAFVQIVKLRARGVMAEPSQIALMSVGYEKAMADLRAGSDPLVIWNKSLPSPAGA